MIKFNALQNRTSGIAFIEGSYLVFLRDLDGRRSNLSLTNLQIKIRGSNSQHYYFYDQLNKGEEICIQDRRILELLAERNIPRAKSFLQQAKTQNIILGLFVGSPIAFILGLLIALPILLSFLQVSWVVAFLSPVQEKRLGAWLFPLFRAQHQVVVDHPAQTKLRILLNQLNKANPELESLEIELFVSTSSQVNAFAAPGNYIVLNQGLIESANSQEEVLGVLAHEVGHIEQKHVFKSLVGGIGSLLGTAGIATVVGFDTALAFASTHPASAERVRLLTQMLAQQPKITPIQLPVQIEELKAAF